MTWLEKLITLIKRDTLSSENVTETFMVSAKEAISVEVDPVPAEGSDNLVTSGGVYTALATKADKSYVDDLVQRVKGTSNTYTIASSSWSALADSAPFDYSATVTITTTLGENSTLELINNNALLFANYGFSILSVSGQTATIASIGQPDGSVTLKVVVING